MLRRLHRYLVAPLAPQTPLAPWKRLAPLATVETKHSKRRGGNANRGSVALYADPPA